MKRNLLFLSILLLITVTLASCSPAAPVEAPAPEESIPEETTPEVTETAAAPGDEWPEDDFLPYVMPVYEDLEGHIGSEVTVAGYVMYRDSYEGNDFMVTRMLVECCFDDAAPTGFVTHWETDEPLPDGEWVRVTGTIDRREVSDEATGMTFTQPYLIASQVEVIEPYESEYVFIDAE